LISADLGELHLSCWYF